MNEAFVLQPTPDGGMRLILNLARTGFVVNVSPAELQSIKQRVEAWHMDMHRRSAGTAVSGDSMPYVRSEVMGLLMRRMAEVTPPGLMGAVATAQLKKRVATQTRVKPLPAKAPPKGPPRPDRVKLSVVVNGLKTVTDRRARALAAGHGSAKPSVTEIAQAKEFARTEFQRAGIPTTDAPHVSWTQPHRVIANKVAATVNAIAAMGAPRKAPLPDGSKVKIVTRALATVAHRRAMFLAATKRKSNKPTPVENAEGKAFAEAHFKGIGIPTTNAAAKWWNYPIKEIANTSAAAVNSAIAKGAPAKPPTQRVIDPNKTRLVQQGLRLLATRRARMIAYEKRKSQKPTSEEIKQGEAFANAQFTAAKIPTTIALGPFWDKKPAAIKVEIDAVLKKAETLGAPKNAPQLFKLEASKLRAVQKALRLVAVRRAKWLAWQRKPGSRVETTDIKAGEVFAKDFALKNGIPSTDAPHQFWAQPLPIIETKVNSVAKLAEAQGAPQKPPVPLKPIATIIAPSKVTIITRGLQELAGRRARFLAFQRKATVTSPADIQAGKDFARRVFTHKGIPVRLPGKKTTIAGNGEVCCVVKGWIAPRSSLVGAAGAATRAREMGPKITDATAARSALTLARSKLSDARATVERKFGGALSRATGEHRSALSLVDQNATYINRVVAMVPPSGPITDPKIQNMVALAVIQAGDNAALIDRLEGTTFANAITDGVNTLFGSAIAAIVDAVSAFWAQPEVQIKQKVNEVLKDKEIEKEAPSLLSLPTAPPVMPPAPGDIPPGKPPAGEMPIGERPGQLAENDPPAGDFTEQAEQGETPGDMPAEHDSDGAAPGDLAQPVEPTPYSPGTLATADLPDMQEYPAGEQFAEDTPGENEGETPGEIDTSVTDPASAFAETDPMTDPAGEGVDIDNQAIEDQSLAAATEEYSEQDFAPASEMEMPPETAEEPTQFAEMEQASESFESMPGEPTEDDATLTYTSGENMYGVATPKKITKKKYEQIVRGRARVEAGRIHKMFHPGSKPGFIPIPGKARIVTHAVPLSIIQKHKIASLVWARAKAQTDVSLAQKGITVMGGDSILGVSDIMGAEYIIGKVQEGDRAAKGWLSRTIQAARKGHPQARLNMRALDMAKKMRRRRRHARPRHGGAIRAMSHRTTSPGLRQTKPRQAEERGANAEAQGYGY